MNLSKSTFIRGLQCEKSLYLYKHHYKLKDPTPKSLHSGRWCEYIETFERIYNDYKISKPYFQEYHYSLFELRDAIVKLDSGNNISKEIIKLNGETLFRNSHRDFVELFISILDYHNSGKKKTKLDNYLAIAKRLNYPIFDKAYCVNYFSN